MVLYVLEIKADLENVEKLELPEGYSYCIDVQVKDTTSDDGRQGVYVSSLEVHDLVNSRGTCNFQVKWTRDAKSSAYLNVVEQQKGMNLRSIPGERSGAFTPFIVLDCRGLEPTGFHPEVSRAVQGGWKVTTLGGTVFEDVDLRDDWADYCEKKSETVGIYSIEARFVSIKG